MTNLVEEDFSFKHAAEVFDRYNLEYQTKEKGYMMWVSDGNGKVYSYYPTTHRWAPRHMKGSHYRAKSTEDFVERFVLGNTKKEGAFKDMVSYKFNLHQDAALYDLVLYIYEAFDQGDSIGKVQSDIHKLMWGGVQKHD